MTNQYSQAAINGSVPDIIGYPGHQSSNSNNKGFDSDYDNIVKDKLVIATMIPVLPSGIRDANIYNPKNAIGEFQENLKNIGITMSQTKLQIAMSRTEPVTTSYENTYDESSILKAQSLLGDKGRELMMLTGASSMHDLRDKMSDIKDKSALQKFGLWGADKWASGTDALKNIGYDMGKQMNMPMIGAVADATSQVLDSPWSKIGWPKMWKDCRFESNYKVNTRLYCFNTSNDKDYMDNIEASLASLLLFVAPRSDKGMLYTAPYMCQFEIPGMVYFPIAYISDMTVIKGGDHGDFAANGRPNVVDINFTVNNCYNVLLNSKEENTYPHRPTIKKELVGLSTGRNLYKKRNLVTGGTDNTSTANVSYQLAANNNGLTTVDLEPWDSNKDSYMSERSTPSETDNNAANALAQQT